MFGAPGTPMSGRFRGYSPSARPGWQTGMMWSAEYRSRTVGISPVSAARIQRKVEMPFGNAEILQYLASQFPKV